MAMANISGLPTSRLLQLMAVRPSLRAHIASGSYANDPNAFGRNFAAPNTKTVNLENWEGDVLSAAKNVPGPVGAFAKVAETGIRGANADVVDKELERMGFSRGLSFGQKLGAAFGFNSYGTGGPAGKRAAQQMAAKRGGYTSPTTGPNARRGHRAGNQSGGAERGRAGNVGDPERGVSRDVDRGLNSGGYGV